MSYRITMDGQPFCSSNVEHSAVLDPSVSLEVNKAGTLKFTILPDHPMYDQIALRQSMFDVYQNDELIFEGIATQEDTDFYNRKVISCEGELTFLNDSIQRQAKYTNQSVQSLLGAYLTVHNAQVDADRQFSLGSVTVSEGNGILRYTNFQSTMKEIGEDLVDNYGGYLRVRHQGGYRYLDYLADPPRTSSQVIRLGKNLIDYSSNLSSLNIITCLIPRGVKIEGEEDVEGLEKRLDIKSVNSGKDYLIGTAASWYGNVWGTQTWDGVTTAAALKAKGQEYLEDAQWSNLVISASAIDLGLMEEDVEQFRLLDMIRVVSEPHGIDRLFLLSKLEINLDHPADTKITLGKDTKLSLSARSAKNSTEIQSVETRILPSASENAKQILDSSTDGNIYFRFDDQTGKLYEIDIMDTNDPSTAQRIWRWNIGGWGYSSDGGQSYTVAATMDGAILATMITTGILKSDGVNPNFYLDLDNGVLKGNFSELKISGNAGATQAYADQAEADAVSAAASNTSTAISTYDTNLNQLAVFNKLTNNQANQGIYIQNGQLYINASMINSGYISAARIEANSIAVSKLTGNIKDSGNTWTIDLDNGTMTLGKLAVGSITGSKSLGNNWSIDFTNGTMSIGNLSANNITAGTITAAVTATDLTMSGGSINIETQSATADKIALQYGSGSSFRKSVMSPESFFAINGDGWKTIVNAGRIYTYVTVNGVEKNTSYYGNAGDGASLYLNDKNETTKVYAGIGSSGGGIVSLYNASGDLTAMLSNTVSGYGSISLRDGTHDRAILNDGGLYFYDSGGTQRLRVNPAASGQITITPTVVSTW